jgi:hypothetical protein
VEFTFYYLCLTRQENVSQFFMAEQNDHFGRIDQFGQG